METLDKTFPKLFCLILFTVRDRDFWPRHKKKCENEAKRKFSRNFLFPKLNFVLNQTHTAETERLARKRKKRMMKMWRKILVFEFSTLSCDEGHDRAAFPPLILSEFIGGKRKAKEKRESVGDCTHVGEQFSKQKIARCVPDLVGSNLLCEFVWRTE